MQPTLRQQTGSHGLWQLGAAVPSAESEGLETRPGLSAGSPRLGQFLLALALVAAVAFSARDITSEGAVSSHGDMPRHAMNGVFIYDLLTSSQLWTSGDLMGEAQRYFVRYPALSLGHHPPLLPVVLAPFYATLGVSIFSARVAILVCALAAILGLYALARRLYDPVVAGWSSLFLATNPFMAFFGQQVMSEMLMVALILLALAALVRFCDTGRPLDFIAFGVAAVASLGARQLAVFMAPVYLAILIFRAPRAFLLQRPVALMLAAGVALAVLMAALTLLLSPFNVWVLKVLLEEALSEMSLSFLWSVLSPTFDAQMTWGAALCALAAAAGATLRRDRRVLLSLVWIVATLSCMVMLASAEPARYSIAVIGGYALLAGSLAAIIRSHRSRWAITCLLIAGVGSQAWAAAKVRPTGAEGYETAARFVLAQGASPTVLYSASVDTGYFVFFVRKHDPARRQVVLRSDKLLTTSLMGWLDKERHIGAPEEIYPLLQTYGVRFVVIEDRPSGSKVLDWLRDELRTDRFSERFRTPIISLDPRLQDVSLVVYEYLDAREPDVDAAIDMRIPLVGREFAVPLADLLEPAR